MNPSLLVPLHGIGTRHDLPLPFSFVVAGAAAALVVSFVVLLLAWRSPRLAVPGGRPLPRLTAVLDRPSARLSARLLVLALYVWVGLGVVAGPDQLTNPVFGFVYVWVWVGLVPVSLLLGHAWRATNPLRTLHRGLAAIARTDPGVGLVRLPRRVGVWPAVVGLFGFAWLELVEPERTSLAIVRVWILAWLVLMIIGAVLFGEDWIGAADPFEAYAEVVARLSPWHRGADPRAPEVPASDPLYLVTPLRNLGSWSPPAGAVGIVATLLGSTAYDSFANTTWWIRTVQTSTLPPQLWETGGLLAMITIVGGSFAAAAAWMSRFGADGPVRELPTQMAGSVVPIVVGYSIAHYATLLIVEGQRTLVNLSDPVGLGWNVLGLAGRQPDASIYDHPTLVALIQLGAIVGGHVLGIVVAHDRTLQLVLGRSDRDGVPGRSTSLAQLPMLLVMVGYTCAGLLLLFSP